MIPVTKLLKRYLAKPTIGFQRNSSQYLEVNNDNGTREIILNHEKTRNSLSLDMMTHLVNAIKLNDNDPALRAIVLSAKGSIFSAGHNLKELHASTGIDHHRLIFKKASELMKSIVQSPVPVIAKVNGLAAAAGCQLVASCDMIVCSDVSRFSTPGASFGIFCSTPGIAIGRCVPKSRAMYMLLTGEPISAKEAYDSGLVTKVVPVTELDSEVQKIIEKIKTKSRSVISIGKEFYYKQIELSLSEAYDLGEEKMLCNINMGDGQEGIQSFIEKRKPKWSHN